METIKRICGICYETAVSEEVAQTLRFLAYVARVCVFTAFALGVISRLAFDKWIKPRIDQYIEYCLSLETEEGVGDMDAPVCEIVARQTVSLAKAVLKSLRDRVENLIDIVKREISVYEYATSFCVGDRWVWPKVGLNWPIGTHLKRTNLVRLIARNQENPVE